MKARATSLLLLAFVIMGQSNPAASGSRIQSILYSPDQVVPLAAAEGFAVVVEFAQDERIDTIVVGDSSGWQVSANKRGDQLVVKPHSGAPSTNMVVTTDTRRYIFLLEPTASSGLVPFVIRFQYPPAVGVSLDATPVVSRYRFKGARMLFPTSMMDDGLRTRIRWSSDTPLPAVAAVDGQGRESIVNGLMIGGEYVIEGVSAAYTFRRDKAHASATRTAAPAARR